MPRIPDHDHGGTSLDDDCGSALLICLLCLLVLSVVGASLLVAMDADLHISSNVASRQQGFYQAESGLERTRVDLAADSDWALQILDTSTSPPTLVDPFPETVTINDITVTLDTESGTVVPGYYPLGGEESFEVGAYSRDIFMPPTSIESANASGSRYWVTFPVRSTGTAGDASPATENVRADTRVLLRDMSVWNNAIFAGNGQAGNMINGNVQVRGSIHVLGDPDNPATLDWGGGSGVQNNYDGIADSSNFGPYASKIPALPTREFNGETVETLDAETWLKNADLDLSGGASVGEEDVQGDSDKETVDGLWSDGDVDTSGSSSVNADETGDYDINQEISFPGLDDPYTDANGTEWSSHRDFLNASSLTLPVNEISDNTAPFAYSDASGNSVVWNPATGVLEVQGNVRVEGDLTFGRAGPTDTIQYSGTGTIYATQDIDVRWNVLPENDYITPDALGNSDNLGLIADRNVEVATSGGASWLRIMAAIYGEESINVAKQTRIAGGLVGDYFDMGQNVPRIFQVPDLASNVPPGMPGTQPLVVTGTTDLDSWYHER